MDDIALSAEVAPGDTVYVSPIHGLTYLEHIDKDDLGGPAGYFISRQKGESFEILAKAASLDAARILFGMLTSRGAISG